MNVTEALRLVRFHVSIQTIRDGERIRTKRSGRISQEPAGNSGEDHEPASQLNTDDSRRLGTLPDIANHLVPRRRKREFGSHPFISGTV